MILAPEDQNEIIPKISFKKCNCASVIGTLLFLINSLKENPSKTAIRFCICQRHLIITNMYSHINATTPSKTPADVNKTL